MKKYESKVKTRPVNQASKTASQRKNLWDYEKHTKTNFIKIQSLEKIFSKLIYKKNYQNYKFVINKIDNF